MSRKPPQRPGGRRLRGRPPRRGHPTPVSRPARGREINKPENSQASTERGSSKDSEEHPRNANQGARSTYNLRKAADLIREAGGRHEAGPILRFRWIRDGESVEIRFVSDTVVTLPVHAFVSDGHGKKLNLQCLGDDCCLCLSGDRPEETCLLLVYALEDRDLAVLRFKNSSYPGTLGAQLLPLLGQEEYLNLIVELQRLGNSYRASIITVIDTDDPDQEGMDFGDDVLADLVERGGPPPEELAALIERRSNQQLLMDLPWLNDKLRRRGIDTSTL